MYQELLLNLEFYSVTKDKTNALWLDNKNTCCGYLIGSGVCSLCEYYFPFVRAYEPAFSVNIISSLIRFFNRSIYLLPF